MRLQSERQRDDQRIGIEARHEPARGGAIHPSAETFPMRVAVHTTANAGWWNGAAKETGLTEVAPVVVLIASSGTRYICSSSGGKAKPHILLVRVPVTDNQQVAAGDVVALINDHDYRITLDQAEAQWRMISRCSTRHRGILPNPLCRRGLGVAADEVIVTWSYKRRMYHAAKLPIGRTANNTQSNPRVM